MVHVGGYKQRAPWQAIGKNSAADSNWPKADIWECLLSAARSFHAYQMFIGLPRYAVALKIQVTPVIRFIQISDYLHHRRNALFDGQRGRLIWRRRILS